MSTKRLISRSVSLVALMLFISPALEAQDFSTFDSVAPEKLLDTSLRTWSQSEKVAIRTYLLRKYPDTKYGMFSKAWLEDYEGHGDESLKVYRECVSRFPGFIPALYNLASSLKGKEQIEAYQAVLALDPSHDNYGAIRLTYFAYADNLKDKKSADEFLERWEKQLPGVYIFDFIRGLYAQSNEKDNKKAEQHYLKAIDKGTDDLEVHTRLTDLRISQTDVKDVDKQVEHLNLIVQYFQENRRSDEAIVYLADKYWKSYKAYKEAFELYRQAFQIHPTGESAANAFNAGKNRVLGDAYEFLSRANKTLPNSHKILSSLGFYFSRNMEDAGQAEDYYKQSVRYSYTMKDEVANAVIDQEVRKP